MNKELYQFHPVLPIPPNLKDNLFYNKSDQIDYIDNISKVNIITGANNSGKSLFIRSLVNYKLEENKSLDKSLLLASINKQIKVESDRIEKLLANFNLNRGLIRTGDFKERYSIITSLEEYQAYIINREKENAKLNDQLTSINEKYVKLDQIVFDKIIDSINRGNDYIRTLIIQTVNKIRIIDIPPIYIPTIRTLRTFFREGTSSEFFTKKTKEEYNFTSTNIENGEHFYYTIFKWNNSEKKFREKVEKFANFLRDNFFYNEVDFITDYENNVLRIKIGNELDQPIHHLGDGLQMIIILTFPLFNYDSGIIAIEEPELFIHPGLQKKLLDIYLNHEYSKNFIFFIATHSNHIIDVSNISDKTSVFSMCKYIASEDDHIYPNFILRNITYGDEHVLNQLGVTNTSVYLTNCSIWVEGVTEILYIRKYIQCYLSDKNDNLKSKYKKCLNFQEGIAYSFVITGGDNIIHFDFTSESDLNNLEKKVKVKYLCGKAMVLVDNDQNKNIKRKRQLTKELGMRFKVLDVIEIENLLPLEAVIEAVKSYPSWEHLSTEELMQKVTTSHKGIRMGSFIDNILLRDETSHIKRPKSFKKDNRDIKDGGSTLRPNDKVKFCEKAIDFVTFDNMTQESKLLVENILDFILLKNPSYK